MLRKLVLLIALSSIGLVSGCVSTNYSSEADIAEALMLENTGKDEYLIGPSDVITVSVWRNADLSISVPVRPDGKISMPLIGDVEVNNITPQMLGEKISKELSTFIKEPKVSIVVTSMGSYEYSSRVRVTGAVSSQLSLPYKDGMTILDMVLAAGGVNDFASPSNSTLYRSFNNKVVAIPVDLDAILLEGDISSNYSLIPGDVITVPEKSF